MADPRRKVDCLMRLAGAQHMERRLEEAAGTYRKVLRLNPKTRYALNNLAYLLAEDLGQPAEALRYAEQAFQLAREDANVIDTLGWVECLAGQYDAARCGRPWRSLRTWWRPYSTLVRPTGAAAT